MYGPAAGKDEGDDDDEGETSEAEADEEEGGPLAWAYCNCCRCAWLLWVWLLKLLPLVRASWWTIESRLALRSTTATRSTWWSGECDREEAVELAAVEVAVAVAVAGRMERRRECVFTDSFGDWDG